MTSASLCSRLLANGPYARSDAPYGLLEVAGPDAGDFLQRVCTQDVLAAAEGVVVPAAFLDAKGKVKATCLVFRLGGSFWLETHAEQAASLAELLERFHFTEKLTIAARDLGPCHECIFSGRSENSARSFVVAGKPVVTVWFWRRGVQFQRCHGAVIESTIAHDDGSEEPIVPHLLTNDLAECLRMVAGLVRVGVETEPSTLALEADLDDHCSTTKGCYTGQEIVARIHTYGHVNRKLCLLQLAAGEPITAPQPLLEPEDQLAVGRVMHAVPLPDGSARVGVGYLPKDFQAIGTLLALEGGGIVEVIGYEPLAGNLPA